MVSRRAEPPCPNSGAVPRVTTLELDRKWQNLSGSTDFASVHSRHGGDGFECRLASSFQ